MKYLLDSDICIYYLKEKFPAIASKLAANLPHAIGIPAVVKGELMLGALKNAAKEKILERLVPFLSTFQIVPFGDKESQVYARVRADLETKGTPIGPNDYLIAATALSLGATLVTHNTREFSKVAGLAIEDWTS